MYFRDKNGLVWRQEQGGYRNIGISVKEQMVTFKKVSDIQIQPSAVMVPYPYFRLCQTQCRLPLEKR